ncbi:MAG TPA: cyanophycin synthetase, partial [Polyangiaceae bacterium]|nr:cyanophycin synthetase [Polyangiaceae bacterium]
GAGRKLRYGFSEAADVRALRRDVAALGRQRLLVESSAGRTEIDVPLLGEAGAYATLAALSVGQVLGLGAPGAGLGEALAAAGEPGRLRALELGDGSVLLDDTYNANPASMLASLAAAVEIARARGARLLLVLGEMRELGTSARVEHDKVGQAVARSGAAALIAVGGDAELYVAPARAAGLETSFASDSAAALELALARVTRGDVVLIKASRGVRAEQVVEGLLKARGRAA